MIGVISRGSNARSGVLGLVGATALLMAARPASAGDKHWNIADIGFWNTGANWSPAGAPGGADAVFIGDTAPATNGWVNLNADASIASLTITDGMVLETDVSAINVAGLLTVLGYNSDGQFGYPSRIIVKQGAALFDCTAEGIVVDDGASVVVSGAASLRVDDLFVIGADGALSGEGYVFLFGDNPTALRVNGGIGAGTAGLVINQLGSGLIDLDGDFAGDSTITIGTYNANDMEWSNLTINGDQLTDAFDDHLTIGANNFLEMDLSQGWTMGPGSLLRFAGNGQMPGPAQVNGGALTLLASMEFSGTGAHGQFNVPLTLMPAADAVLGPEDRMECNGATTIEGGSYTLGEDARIDFDGSTTVHGGTFATFSDLISDGSVNFNGQTAWDGEITVHGVARQVGSASVTGPSVINADLFDMDGFAVANHEWNIANSLTINADHLEQGNVSNVDSTINLTGTFLGKLTVNLTSPSGWWAVSRTLNVGGVGAILITRVAGSAMVVYGTMNVSNRVGISADLFVSSVGQVNFLSDATELRVSGSTEIQQYAELTGNGELHNAAGGVLILHDGADLGGVGVRNDGQLRLGNSPGVAFIDRFASAPGAVWSVDLGGYTPGAQHDLLFVTEGVAQLDGTLDVNLIDLGEGVFVPQVGDSFIILRSSGQLNGSFTNNPVSYASGNAYLWSVGVDEDFVTLHLDQVVQCAADLNSDGVVDGADLGLLLGTWGPCKACPPDLNGDHIVDGADLGALLGAWGPCL